MGENVGVVAIAASLLQSRLVLLNSWCIEMGIDLIELKSSAFTSQTFRLNAVLIVLTAAS